MSKLAKAAALQLKGVIVEYDALCSTLIGRTAVEQAEQRRRTEALHAQQERDRDAQGVGLFTKVSGMFVNDVRSLLKDLNQDATGKPWIVKERLQSTLQGLPTDVLDRVTGEKVDQQAAGKSEEELYLEKQLASASAEIERMKLQRASEKQELLKRRNGDTSGSGGVRDKYLDKLNMLKAKAKTRDPNAALAAVASVSATVLADVAASTPAKGLTTWLVHEGANELMSYSTTRGLAKAILPPQSDLQAEEFRLFCKEMEDQFDYVMPDDEYAKLPDQAPLLAAIKALELSALEVLVVARHSSTIRAAKAAGAYTCHFRKAESDIPNHSADYQLVGLKDFQFVVEEFNGISYRGRLPQWHPTHF